MPLPPPDITGYLASSSLPEVSLLMKDGDPRQGMFARGALRCAARTLLDLLDGEADRDQIARGAERALAIAAAARAGLSSDEHVAAVGLAGYANALLAACRDRGFDEEVVRSAVICEIDRLVAPFVDGSMPLPPLA